MNNAYTPLSKNQCEDHTRQHSHMHGKLEKAKVTPEPSLTYRQHRI